MDEIQQQILAERDPDVLKAKMNLETAKMPWQDLERFFASGALIVVQPALDLTDVAVRIALDDSQAIQGWMHSGLIGQASDAEATKWHESQANLWACVVKPWVLVQDGDAQPDQ